MESISTFRVTAVSGRSLVIGRLGRRHRVRGTLWAAMDRWGLRRADGRVRRADLRQPALRVHRAAQQPRDHDASGILCHQGPSVRPPLEDHTRSAFAWTHCCVASATTDRINVATVDAVQKRDEADSYKGADYSQSCYSSARFSVAAKKEANKQASPDAPSASAQDWKFQTLPASIRKQTLQLAQCSLALEDIEGPDKGKKKICTPTKGPLL